MKLKKPLLLVIPLLVLGLVILLRLGAADAAFNANDVIDDGVFNNMNSMNAFQIDSWLNSIPNSCISTNHGFSSADPTGYNPSQGFIFGSPVSAGKVIYDSAQAYEINPQVLMATLQKEEGLVRGDGPYGCGATAMASATGFGCTDSGTNTHNYTYPGNLSTPLYYSNGTPVNSVTNSCVNSATKAGFSEQVIWAAWLLERGLQRSEGNVNWAIIKGSWDNSDESDCYGGPMTQGNRKRCASDTNSVFYDGYTTIDGQSIHMDTGATAALYWYTPHLSGNQSFYNLFTSWFGSTHFPQPLGGLLYYQNSTGKIFLITTDNSTRYYIPNWSMLQNYRLDRYPIQPVDDTTLQQYTDGGNLTSLIWDSNGVFLVNNGIKYHVPSSTTCTNWALACFDNTVTKQLGSGFQSSYLASGTDLANLANYNGVFYKMQGGQRLPIADSNTLSVLGFAPNQALYFTDANATQPIGNLLLSTATAIKFNGSPTIYYYDGSAYHKFADPTLVSAWGLTAFAPPVSAYDSTPPATSGDMSRWYQAGDGSKFLIDQGRKILLSTDQQQLWPSATYQTFASTLANSLSTINFTAYVWAAPNIYLISGGQKHYVPTYDDYVSLGINQQNSTSISSNAMDLVQQGADTFGAGKLVGIAGASKIYVVSLHKLVHIPDPGTFNAFGFDWSKIATYPSSILSDYPEDGVLTATLSYDGNFNFILGSQRLKMSPQMGADYGLKTELFKSIEKQVSSRLTSGLAVSRFLYNQDDGKIYYASGGGLHYVSSYQAFIGYGGRSTPSTSVNSSFVADFVIAQPI